MTYEVLIITVVRNPPAMFSLWRRVALDLPEVC